MSNKEKMVDFIKNGSKKSFARNPRGWFIRNNLSEYLFLIEDPFKTKEKMLELAYGIPLCRCCKMPHKRILGNAIKLGWAKTCSEICQQKLASDRQQGSKNTSHRMTPETRKNAARKISIALKEKILNGSLTPKSENYRLFGTLDFMLNGTKHSVRSLWEMIYWMQNPSLEYEKIRIKYYDTILKRERIYITDFYDRLTNTIIEIKPTKYQNTLHDKAKAVKEQGYLFKILDEEYFNKCKTDSMIQQIKDCSLDYDKIKNRLKWLKKARNE